MDANKDGANIFIGDFPRHRGGGGGGDMLEPRVAKLEADVEHIKINMSEVRADVREIKASASDTQRDVAVILQKLVDIDSSLTKRPTADAMESKFNGMKLWFISILLLSIAMPVITLLVNLYMKKS
ncbi:hypothetical protein I1S38_21545 [Serratia ureilytica]|uniref:hypothetical protein n=1 Tax=Serratia ureilytica TaxID=300181 RepID=UPI0018A70D7B|nr:hypothetical protein [Serratia ureilytica]MBF4186953.1 hypothetical protein [Serratia ureilytica]MBF8442351.1 hypothetical protein [Serratia ureilytica]MBF8446052.1 hypothetical protein [Serratia ureilytica]